MPGMWLYVSKCRETAIPTFCRNRKTPYVVREFSRVQFWALNERAPGLHLGPHIAAGSCALVIPSPGVQLCRHTRGQGHTHLHTHRTPHAHTCACFLPSFFHGFYAQGPAASVGSGPSVSLPTTRKRTPQPCPPCPMSSPSETVAASPEAAQNS